MSRQRWLDAGKTVPFPEDLAGRAMFDEVLGELRSLGHRPLWARFVAWFRGASDGEVREALEAMRARRKAREEAAARELELDAWESQAFSLPASHARLRGSLVWMYHGTSSAAREGRRRASPSVVSGSSTVLRIRAKLGFSGSR